MEPSAKTTEGISNPTNKTITPTTKISFFIFLSPFFSNLPYRLSTRGMGLVHLSTFTSRKLSPPLYNLSRPKGYLHSSPSP
jgi:hypothetical protein